MSRACTWPRPRVSHSADLVHTAKALAPLRNRQAAGKVVLTMSED